MVAPCGHDVGGGSGGRWGVGSGTQSEKSIPGARTRSPLPGGRRRPLRRVVGGVVGSGIVRDLRRCGSGALRGLGTGLGLGLAHAVALALAPSFARESAASLPGMSACPGTQIISVGV